MILARFAPWSTAVFQTRKGFDRNARYDSRLPHHAQQHVSSASAGCLARSGKPAERWTTRRLLQWMGEHFKAKDVDSPRVVAEMLLAHVLNC